MQIGSFERCNDLRKLGFRENKTKSLTVPHVPKKYFSSFVRGYFDGDGHVWAGLMNKKRVVPTKAIITVFTSCSLIFLKKLQRRLAESGINGGVIRTADKNYSRLTYSIKSSLKLYDFMYNKSVLEKTTLFLKRKKIVFEKYKKLRQVSYCDRSSVG